MRYLFTFFIMLIIGCINNAYAVEPGDPFRNLYLEEQDTLGNGKRQEKRVKEKEKDDNSAQAENTLKKVPKAKNKAIPRTVGPTSINIKSPRINPVKVKVNTQVKIKL